jgi:hypothetical protein
MVKQNAKLVIQIWLFVLPIFRRYKRIYSFTHHFTIVNNLLETFTDLPNCFTTVQVPSQEILTSEPFSAIIILSPEANVLPKVCLVAISAKRGTGCFKEASSWSVGIVQCHSTFEG